MCFETAENDLVGRLIYSFLIAYSSFSKKTMYIHRGYLASSYRKGFRFFAFLVEMQEFVFDLAFVSEIK